jgi:beta-galactosidase
VEIAHLRVQLISNASSDQRADTSNWFDAVNGRGEYAAVVKDSLQKAEIRGYFDLPEISENIRISVWPKSLGEVQEIQINGHQIVKNIQRDDAVKEYILDHKQIQKGKNVYTLLCTPLRKRYQYDNLNTDPGIIQVVTPAVPWKRKAFNGVAQVIVQGKKEIGSIKLTSSSVGLESVDIQIQSLGAEVRPAIP